MASPVEHIHHFHAEEVTQDPSLPTPAQGTSPLSPPPRQSVLHELPKTARSSIPTSVIQSCFRSTSTGQSSMSSSSSYEASGEDSDEEQPTRKRTMTSENENATNSKIIKKGEEKTEPHKVIRVVPLRPICSVYLVSYGQEDSTDQHAGRTRNPIDEPFEGLPLDLKSFIEHGQPTWRLSVEQRRRRRELESHIFTERFKTVWHTETTGPDGEQVLMTVPFTVDVSDIFNSYTDQTVPVNVRMATFRYALERAEKLANFKRLFSMNNPHKQRISTKSVKISKPDTTESRIVFAGRRNAQMSNSRSV